MIKVAFSVDQETENYFKVPLDNMDHRFFDFIQIHFGLVTRQKISSQCLATTRKLCLLTSQNCILGWSGARKLVECAMRAIEISLNRSQQRRILEWQESVNEFKVTCEHLQHRFLDFTQV